MRASATPPLLMLTALFACSPKTAAGTIECEAGDPDACEIVASRYFLGEGAPRDANTGAVFLRRSLELRAKACLAGQKDECEKGAARVGVAVYPSATAPVPLDVPRPPPGSEEQVVFTVDVPDAQHTSVNGKAVADDAALLAATKKQVAEHPETRAVIRADKNVPHGRVVAVLDTLKQAGVSKIAFGVSPAATAAPR